jgi:t-SNARE complex subunit (syntaxin)
MTKCSEIERLALVKSPTVRELIDTSVRKVVETQQVLERYKAFLGHGKDQTDPRYKRLVDNFTRASCRLEEVIRNYTERSKLISASDHSATPLNEVPRTGMKSTQIPPLSSYDYISSMEEGSTQSLHDLSRIGKEMSNLQDIYVSLNEVVVNQQASLLDSVQSRLSRAADTAKNTVTELSRTQGTMDYWTRVKLYAITGTTAIGLFLWLV